MSDKPATGYVIWISAEGQRSLADAMDIVGKKLSKKLKKLGDHAIVGMSHANGYSEHDGYFASIVADIAVGETPEEDADTTQAVEA